MALDVLIPSHSLCPKRGRRGPHTVRQHYMARLSLAQAAAPFSKGNQLRCVWNTLDVEAKPRVPVFKPSTTLGRILAIVDEQWPPVQRMVSTPLFRYGTEGRGNTDGSVDRRIVRSQMILTDRQFDERY